MKKHSKSQHSSQDNVARYVTVFDVVQEAGVSERTIRRWIASKRIHAIYDKTGHIRLDLDEVLAQIKPNGLFPLHHRVDRLEGKIMEMECILDAVVDLTQELRGWQQEMISSRQEALYTEPLEDVL